MSRSKSTLMYKRLRMVLPAGLVMLALAACSDRGEVDLPVGVDRDDVIATVNGKPIPGALLQMFVAQRTGGQPMELSAEQREELVNELVEMELLVQAAQARGIHREAEMAAQLLGSYKSTLARAYLQEHMQQAAVDEDDLRAAYEEQEARGGTEYRASHILVESEDEARALIERLADGGDFAQLAREHSEGPTGEEGGNLGWFSLEDMVPRFGDAIAAMEAGEYTSEPVRTQFGWHVIKLEDTRDRELPAFEDMREELARDLRLNMIESLVAELREDARIRIKEDQ